MVVIVKVRPLEGSFHCNPSVDYDSKVTFLTHVYEQLVILNTNRLINSHFANNHTNLYIWYT